MALSHLVSRPVPRAGALLLFLAGVGTLTLGGLLAGQAAFSPDNRILFLHDARLQHATAAVDDEADRATELRRIHRRGGPPRYVEARADQANRYFDQLREARDVRLREYARRWRRTQTLMGGWLAVAGLAFLVTGVRLWRRSGAEAGATPAPG